MKEVKKCHYLTKYKCEVCDKIYFSSVEAVNCEKSHTCEHDAFYEFEVADNSAWWFNVKGIFSICKKCNMALGSVDFEDIDDSQEILERIYQLVVEYNQRMHTDIKQPLQ